MSSEPLNVGLGGLLMGFGSLVAHLDAKGLINKNEFASILDGAAVEFSEGLAAEMKALANVLRDRSRPNLTAIDGGKSGYD